MFCNKAVKKKTVKMINFIDENQKELSVNLNHLERMVSNKPKVGCLKSMQKKLLQEIKNKPFWV